MTRRSRLLRVVEAAERLPPALQPPFWGALLGMAVTAGLILASVPLWLVQGRTDIPAAVLDMAVAGLAAGAAGGATSPGAPSSAALALDPSITSAQLEFVEIYNRSGGSVDLLTAPSAN